MPVTLFADVNNIGWELLLSAQAGFAVRQGAANDHTGRLSAAPCNHHWLHFCPACRLCSAQLRRQLKFTR